MSGALYQPHNFCEGAPPSASCNFEQYHSSFIYAHEWPQAIDGPLLTTRVRMRRDFLNRLIEKYFEQLIDSVQVLQPHCRIFKSNNSKHYCAAAWAGTCQAHMRCTAALDELVHQIWRNRFVYSSVSTQSRSVSLK